MELAKMKKVLSIYSSASCCIVLFVIIYYVAINLQSHFQNRPIDEINGNLFTTVAAYLFLFTVINGVLLLITGIYYIWKHNMKMGIINVVASLCTSGKLKVSYNFVV